ncbi:hypothetical protein [Kitasatospora sp. MBT66]|uniref:hypothetical protein n=1 Tax=Kitasatospora sp. MBT66 TaxID=1444769 RepID=UPI0005BDDA2A|nr:hypothetical protein [Kitasatospora sp. MBT66]
MSLRRLRVLIDHLPPESFTKTALRNAAPADLLAKAQAQARPDLTPWSGVELLLASVLDAVRVQTAVAVAASGGKFHEPEPTPRPGIRPRTTSRRRLTDEQRAALDPRMRDPREA